MDDVIAFLQSLPFWVQPAAPIAVALLVTVAVLACKTPREPRLPKHTTYHIGGK